MAKHAEVIKVADGVTRQFSFAFTDGYMSRDDVHVQVNKETDGTGKPSYRAITWVADGLISVGGAMPLAGQEVRISRVTPITKTVNDFKNGSVLDAVSLDRGFDQAIKAIQELQDGVGVNRLAEDSANSAENSKNAALAALAAVKATASFVFSSRNAANAQLAASLPNGSVVVMAGLTYKAVASATGNLSATVDLGVDGLVAVHCAYPEHFGADGGGAVDDHAALVRWGKCGVRLLCMTAGKTYHITGSNRYATITTAGTYIDCTGAMITSENSADKHIATGTPHYVGLRVPQENCTLVGLNVRGGLVSVTAKVFNAANCHFFNLHNVAFGGSDTIGFDRWTISDCTFSYSLATGVGNYTAISRPGNSSNPWANCLLVTRCKFTGVAGGVNMHKCRRVLIRDCCFYGGDVNHFKLDIGNEHFEMVGCYHNGAPIDTSSANRHLNTGPSYAMFLQGEGDSGVIDVKVEDFNRSGGKCIDFINSTAQRNIVARITGRNSSVPIIRRCGGKLDLTLDLINCGDGAVEIAHPTGVWATNQTVRGSLIESQMIVGRSASGATDRYKTIDISVNGHRTGAGTEIVKAVHTAGSYPYLLDSIYLHGSTLKVATGNAVKGTDNLTEIVLAANNTLSSYTGRRDTDYYTGGSGNLPITERGVLRWKNVGPAITRIFDDNNARVGDIAHIQNRGTGSVALVASGGDFDGHAVTRVAVGSAVTFQKIGTGNKWMTLSELGTITH